MPKKYYKRSLPRTPVQVIGPSIAYVELTHGLWATIDSEDAERVGRFKWHAKQDPSNWYARARVNGKMAYLHRILIDCTNLEVDHANGFGLHNWKGNLRSATKAENMRNKRMSSSCLTGYKGVKRNGKGWQARIGINGKRIALGTYTTPEAAHAAYFAKAKELYGEFANSGIMTQLAG